MLQQSLWSIKNVYGSDDCAGKGQKSCCILGLVCTFNEQLVTYPHKQVSVKKNKETDTCRVVTVEVLMQAMQRGSKP